MQFVHCSGLTITQIIKHSILWKESAPILGPKILPEHKSVGFQYARLMISVPMKYCVHITTRRETMLNTFVSLRQLVLGLTGVEDCISKIVLIISVYMH